jgi:lysyl-tRNA synthetase class II
MVALPQTSVAIPLGKIQIEIFEDTVEEKLIQPTFITEYPTEVSPLARRNDNNPFITDRFTPTFFNFNA